MRRRLFGALAAVMLLAGCAGTPSNDPSGPTSGASSSKELQKVSIALDWAPNTNHTGIYVADKLGYFAENGIKVEILPYASTPAPELVSARKADFGIAGQAVTQTARTRGLDVKSVYRITQTEVGELVTLANRDDINSPKDLEGKTFGGFGNPLYEAMVRTMIEHDGGKPQFTEVVLDTGAYEALSNGRIDFTLAVSTWEGVKQALEGHPYKSFKYQDYGMPDMQAVGIVSSDAYLKEHPQLAKGFVTAVQKGYEYAAANNAEAAKILIDANQDTLGNSQELINKSIEKLSEDGYWVKQGVVTGSADPKIWNEYGKFLYDNKALKDSAGKEISAEPRWSDYYTNEFTK